MDGFAVRSSWPHLTRTQQRAAPQTSANPTRTIFKHCPGRPLASHGAPGRPLPHCRPAANHGDPALSEASHPPPAASQAWGGLDLPKVTCASAGPPSAHRIKRGPGPSLSLSPGQALGSAWACLLHPVRTGTPRSGGKEPPWPVTFVSPSSQLLNSFQRKTGVSHLDAWPETVDFLH